MLDNMYRGTAGRRVIVGVLGRTFKTSEDASVYNDLDDASKKVMFDAEDVAVALTRLKHVVLTGGSIRRPEISVKYRALRAAGLAASPGAPSRTIGILPDTLSRALGTDAQGVRCDPKADPPFIELHSQLTGSDRDKVTGTAADVFIALRGEIGTPREVAAALVAGHPIIFLHSVDALREPTKQALGSSADLFPTQPLVARDSMSAVKLALDSVHFTSDQAAFRGALRRIEAMRTWPSKLGSAEAVLADLHKCVQGLIA